MGYGPGESHLELKPRYPSTSEMQGWKRSQEVIKYTLWQSHLIYWVIGRNVLGFSDAKDESL